MVLGALETRLVGAVGMYRDPHEKASHKGHVWGMYVVPDRRATGLGSRLLEALLEHARGLPGLTQVHLSVTSASPAARRLYERAGFQHWGTATDSLVLGDESVDEQHMVLRL